MSFSLEKLRIYDQNTEEIHVIQFLDQASLEISNYDAMLFRTKEEYFGKKVVFENLNS
jgi:hypothetical protein